jgi:hypothetical protein
MPTPSASVLSRVAPENRAQLQTPLARTEVAALRTMLTAGLLRPALDGETKAALIGAGYVREALGGAMLTDSGAVRAMMEVGL